MIFEEVVVSCLLGSVELRVELQVFLNLGVVDLLDAFLEAFQILEGEGEELLGIFRELPFLGSWLGACP